MPGTETKTGINIVVCIKQVPDPEVRSSDIEVDSELRKVTVKGVPPVLSPFDENALEAALRIRDNVGGKITVLSMGKKLVQRVLVKALAAGADELVLLQDDSFEELDSYSSAVGLAAAIKKIDEFDLILCGIQAADSNEGQVGIGIAEILAIPAVSFVQKVEVLNGILRVEQTIPEGYDVLEVPTPALLTVSSELYELRFPSVPALRAAQKKPVRIWSAADVGIDLTETRCNKIVGLYPPKFSGVRCEIVSGGTMEEIGISLALKIREAGVIF
jgi:electron transfer flavoprotein beta subunit